MGESVNVSQVGGEGGLLQRLLAKCGDVGILHAGMNQLPGFVERGQAVETIIGHLGDTEMGFARTARAMGYRLLRQHYEQRSLAYLGQADDSSFHRMMTSTPQASVVNDPNQLDKNAGASGLLCVKPGTATGALRYDCMNFRLRLTIYDRRREVRKITANPSTSTALSRRVDQTCRRLNSTRRLSSCGTLSMKTIWLRRSSMRVGMANMLISVRRIMAQISRFLALSSAGTPLTTCESITEVTRKTTPHTIPIQCRMPRLRLTTAPASWRLGRIPG